jgi:hypothetical protein
VKVWYLLSLAAFGHPGIGIVADSRGDVYYTDLKHVWRNDEIVVRDVHSHELYMDKNDVLYGEHLWMEAGAARHRIWRRLPSGVVEDVIPARKGYREEYGDFHFVRDAAGAAYAPRPNAGWLAVNARGTRVYSVSNGDLYRNNEIVARGVSENSAVPWHVRAVGWVLRVSRLHDGPDHDVGGLWLDDAENIYVAVPGARTVKRITQRGEAGIVLRGASEWTVVSGAFLHGEHWLLETGEGGKARARRLTAGDARDAGESAPRSGWLVWAAVAVAILLGGWRWAARRHLGS